MRPTGAEARTEYRIKTLSQHFQTCATHRRVFSNPEERYLISSSGESAEHFDFLRFLEKSLPLALQVAAGELGDGFHGLQCGGRLFSVACFHGTLGLCDC